MTKLSEIDLKNFPTTRYQGSKRKILPWIHENIKDLEFTTVLDAFGGTGSVSYLFKKMGKEVTYNDNLKFNYIIGKALIQNQKIILTEEDYGNLFDWIDNNDFDNFIEETFTGIYYLTNENNWLDGVNNGILNMNHYTGQTLDYKKSIAYYALFQSCLIKRPYNLFHRKNLSMRTANVERKFGNKVTWEKSFKKHFKKFIDEANNLVFDSGVTCTATNESAFDIINTNFDLVYLDPPYIDKTGKNETANYLRCYHFLEGLSNYDNWPTLIDFKTKNLRFKAIEEKNDFTKENSNHIFETLIHKFQDSIIVLSYKNSGSPSVDTLVTIMKKYKRNVYTKSIPYTYALKRPTSEDSMEVLIIGI